MFKQSFAAALAAVAVVAEADPYSRAGRELNFVVALNAPALTSPQTNLNLAKDATQESKYANRITPVGQRQQFLIGSELRKRYVEEAQFLSDEYIISQLHLQAPFVARNILSLQAQMMGLYPATEANNLTEWQQSNAVPPIEGVDFSKWQEELGAHALPFGLQTFPIQQTGFEADFMLSLSAKNCKRFDALTSDTFTKIEKSLEEEITASFADISTEMQAKDVSGKELCDYLTWAYYNAVELEGDATRQDQFKTITLETCPTYLYNPVAKTVVDVNSANANLVSGQFLTYLNNTLTMVEGQQQEIQKNVDELPLAFQNFQALTSDILLSVADSLLDIEASEALPASSSLILEYWAKDSSIHAFLNDEEKSLKACAGADVCTVDKVRDFLSNSAIQSDIAATCADTDLKADILN